MAVERHNLAPRRRIPQLDRITEQAGVALDGVNVGEVYAGARFVLGRREQAAVGAPSHAVNPEAAGEREREKLTPAGHFIDFDRWPSRGRSEQAAIAVKRNRGAVSALEQARLAG